MSGDVYELVIDWMGRPLVQNKANKMHWGALGRERTAWGDAAIQAATIARLPRPFDVPVSIEMWGEYPDRRGLPDPDGISPTVKGAVDGLVRGGYLATDTGTHVAGTHCLPPLVDRSLNRPTLAIRITECPSPAPGSTVEHRAGPS